MFNETHASAIWVTWGNIIKRNKQFKQNSVLPNCKKNYVILHSTTQKYYYKMFRIFK